MIHCLGYFPKFMRMGIEICIFLQYYYCYYY